MSIRELTSIPDYELPSVKFSDLVTLSSTTALSVSNHLTSVGALKITEIPNLEISRLKALSSLATCLSQDESLENFEVVMADKSRRRTIGSKSIRGVPNDMNSACGNDAGDLRSSVDMATRQLFRALDLASRQIDRTEGEYLMEPYTTYLSLADLGDHLEHLHSFYAPPSPSPTTTSQSIPSSPARTNSAAPLTTLDLHTDSGLLIAMTAPLYDAPPTQGAGLYMSLPTGSLVRVKGTYPSTVISLDQENEEVGSEVGKGTEGSVIVMVGEGGAGWLSPYLGLPLRAVPHMMISGLQPQSLSLSSLSASHRSWFGKMYLPPSDALLPLSLTPPSLTSTPDLLMAFPFEEKERRMTWSRFSHLSRSLPSKYSLSSSSSSSSTSDSSSFHSHHLPSACGPLPSLSLSTLPVSALSLSPYQSSSLPSQRALVSVDPCLSSEVYCWTMCYPIADYAPCSTPLLCVDPSSGDVHDGADHCTSCVPTCVPPANVTPNAYCRGTGTSMFMSGFTSTATGTSLYVSSPSEEAECVNLLFPSWTLDQPWKFAVACLGVLCLGLSVQWLSKQRMAFINTHRLSLNHKKKGQGGGKGTETVGRPSYFGSVTTTSKSPVKGKGKGDERKPLLAESSSQYVPPAPSTSPLPSSPSSSPTSSENNNNNVSFKKSDSGFSYFNKPSTTSSVAPSPSSSPSLDPEQGSMVNGGGGGEGSGLSNRGAKKSYFSPATPVNTSALSISPPSPSSSQKAKSPSPQSPSSSSQSLSRFWVVVASCGFYCVEQTLSYLLMLVAMTYSVELFCMVVLGLTLGYLLFKVSLPTPPSESLDPCCDYGGEGDEDEEGDEKGEVGVVGKARNT